MLELLEKIDILKKELDKLEVIQNLEKVQLEILNDKELYQKIKNKKQEVLTDSTVIEYKKLENEANFLILEINKYLKQSFQESRRCYHESN